MPILNPATGNAYTQVELTDYIIERPRQPQALTAAVQVSSQGVRGPALLIDRSTSGINIIDPSNYNEVSSVTEITREDPIPLAVPHYGDKVTVWASEVQGQRAPGTDNAYEVPATLLNEKLDAQIANFAVTEEHVLFGAAKAKIIDSKGATRVDLAGAFGKGPTGIKIDFADPKLDVAAEFRKAKRVLKVKLGGMAVTSWQVVCTGELYEALVTKESMKRSYDFYQQGAALRGMSNDGPTPFVVADNMQLWEYEGIDLPGGVTIGPNNELLIIPNVPGLYQRRNAPRANWVEVNQVGRRIYSFQKDIDDKGVLVENEMNFVIYCQRPESTGQVTQK